MPGTSDINADPHVARLGPEVIVPEATIISTATTSVTVLPVNDAFKSSSTLNRIIDIIHRVLGRLSHLNLTDFVKLNPSIPKFHCGGCGDVYEGICSHPRCGGEIRVAVKRFRIDGHTEKALKAIAREMRIWSELDRPNVVPLLGYIIEGTYPSFVSRWMDHGSLHQCLPHIYRMEAVSMILDIACGLVYMHERGAIHSDIKSDNVLVTSDKRAVLTDFGASRMDSLSTGYSTRSIVGSTRWQARELFPLRDDDEGPRVEFSKETDVWAFGMTVYELIAKERPFAHISITCVSVWNIAKGSLPKKPTFSQDPVDAIIEEFMWSLCEDCWKTDPTTRPTMQDLEHRIRFFKESKLASI